MLGMADGYCRASHRLAAANVHVMPGLGNAMGALYNAKFSGSPVILTAGQQEQGHGLLEPLLYEPLVPVAQPLVKWAVEVTRAADLPRIVHRAAKIALTPPTGPVFLSLPGDVLDETLEMDMGRPVRVVSSVQAQRRDAFAGSLQLLRHAKKAGDPRRPRARAARRVRRGRRARRAARRPGVRRLHPLLGTVPERAPGLHGHAVAPAAAGARAARALRPAHLPRRGPAAHVGVQPGRAAARWPAGDPRLRACARAGQELPHRPRGARQRQGDAEGAVAVAQGPSARATRDSPN